MKKIKVALIQPIVHHDNDSNRTNMESLIATASHETPDIICLPERWFHLDFTQKIEHFIQSERGIQYQWVKQWAQKYNCAIISGGIWEYRVDQNQYFITSYYIDKTGRERGRQDKIHLYGIEQQLITPGSYVLVISESEIDVTFSILICFDLNISSDLALLAVNQGSEILFSPTLIRDDGAENWRIYMQARALEMRTPIVSCNSVYEIFDRKFKGESKIIQFKPGRASPAQLEISELDQNSGILIKDINLEFPNKIRNERLEERFDISKIEVKKI